jgi:hypothetical protein
MKISSQLISVGLTVAVLLAGDIALRCVSAQKSSGPAKVLAAQEFRLVDAEGNMHANLTYLKGQPGLVIYGKDKTPRTVLSLGAEGEPVFVMLDKDGKRARFSVDVNDKKDGEPSVRCSDASGKIIWSAP